MSKLANGEMVTGKLLQQQSFSVKDDLKCEHVVVYTDRAEVKRLLKACLKKGENELVIKSVNSSVDKDSVRVEGVGGQAASAVVLDVVCDAKKAELSEIEMSDKIKDAKAEQTRVETQLEINKRNSARVDKQIKVIGQFAKALTKPAQADSVNFKNPNSENLNDFVEFLSVYSTRLEELDKEKIKLLREKKNLDEQLKVAVSNLNDLTDKKNINETIEITILIDSEKDNNQVELLVSYVVTNASWTPKYDIRVYGKDKSMIINYYGLIKQTTGEDWNETKVSLSTATPSIGGQVPELAKLTVSFKTPVYSLSYPSPAQSCRDDFDGAEEESLKACALMDSGLVGGSPEMPKRKQKSKLTERMAEINESSIGSTCTFNIPRTNTIPSDGNEHKVSVCMITLKPEFEYEAVPKKSPYAFIKAKVTNTSQYPILAGPANIFLDNNFIAKANLKDYSPLEEFYCSLGVESAIKIDYKPVKKFQSHSGGLLTKTTSTSYHQEIEIKNTLGSDVKLLLLENVPVASSDKVTVKLIEPVLKNNTKARMNKDNNLEIDLDIKAMKAETVSVKYTIEHSSDRTATYY